MKPSGPWKHVALAFLIALAMYIIAYSWIENRRTRNGPWEVTFTADASDVPGVIVRQPKLKLEGIRLNFPRQSVPPTNATVRFDQAREVPFEVPFGQCLFMDPTFLPGTLAFNFFGHEIQFLPRVLTVDRQEIAWQSGMVLNLTNHGVLAKPGPVPAGKAP